MFEPPREIGDARRRYVRAADGPYVKFGRLVVTVVTFKTIQALAVSITVLAYALIPWYVQWIGLDAAMGFTVRHDDPIYLIVTVAALAIGVGETVLGLRRYRYQRVD